jgi:lipopolysaccharide export system permease protein
VLVFACVVAAGIGVLSYSTRPWAANEMQIVEKRAALEVSADSMSAGRFYELGGEAEQVVFAENRSPVDPQVLQHVFVQYRKGSELSILYSEEALVQRDEASHYRFLRLLDGYRYDLRPDKQEYEITSFEEFVIRTPVRTMLDEEPEQKARPTSELFDSPELRDRSELQWRLSMPVSALILAVLAIPLSRVDPRQGKYAKILLAILLYTVYRQLLSTSKSWVADGDLPVFPGMWIIHVVTLAIALLFYTRAADRSFSPTGWRRLWRASLSP